ncbi:hypothetical protein BDV96DRAFT_78263 [Lophiotrema nucula]|uniref:Uncharacterized protein n=1 Tax=Lophiotrema nucula TaxID=690887 RepID=A0A6A5Z7E7_9PLEO|nr:hypothetical protein BDV96DRAFT_78263 [Lophiotrema nucula]
MYSCAPSKIAWSNTVALECDFKLRWHPYTPTYFEWITRTPRYLPCFTKSAVPEAPATIIELDTFCQKYSKTNFMYYLMDCSDASPISTFLVGGFFSTALRGKTVDHRATEARALSWSTMGKKKLLRAQNLIFFPIGIEYHEPCHRKMLHRLMMRHPGIINWEGILTWPAQWAKYGI